MIDGPEVPHGFNLHLKVLGQNSEVDEVGVGGPPGSRSRHRGSSPPNPGPFLNAQICWSNEEGRAARQRVLDDLESIFQLAPVYLEYLSAPYPARTTVQAGLRGYMVEIEASAAI